MYCPDNFGISLRKRTELGIMDTIVKDDEKMIDKCHSLIPIKRHRSIGDDSNSIVKNCCLAFEKAGFKPIAARDSLASAMLGKVTRDGCCSCQLRHRTVKHGRQAELAEQVSLWQAVRKEQACQKLPDPFLPQVNGADSEMRSRQASQRHPLR